MKFQEKSQNKEIFFTQRWILRKINKRQKHTLAICLTTLCVRWDLFLTGKKVSFGKECQDSYRSNNIKHSGSVWIGLILLKLKIYCWNHCSKIIFKCVNSTVGPIFNEKIAKKWNLWVYKQYIMHCLWQKSQHLWLLFIEQYINSNRVLPKRVKKKRKEKKEQKRKTQTGSKRRRVSNLAHNI